MRLNNNERIITDGDIIMSDGSKNLSDVLESHQKQISQLASNVKWIYKYGGVGGSGGSGGGSASTFSIFATLNQVQIKDQSIVLNGPGIYNLSVNINNPNNGVFNVKYSYKVKTSTGNLTTQEQTVILSVENNYNFEAQLNLNVNSELQITVSDGNETKQAKCSYIVYPYEFYLDLVDDEGSDVPLEHFIETGAVKGVNVRLRYIISIQASINYTYQFLDATQEGQITDKENTILFPIDKSLFVPENAGYYSAQIQFNIIPDGQQLVKVNKSLSFSLIPEDLYLLIQPQSGIIYDKETEEPYEYAPGYITFDYKVYEGISQNRTYNVSINLNDINIVKSSVTERQQNTFKLFSITPGLNKLDISVNRTTTYTKTYYFYIQESSLVLDWFDNPEEWTSYYYRINETTSNFEQFKNKLYIEQSVNSAAITVNDIDAPNVSANTLINTHIAIGLQYNAINSENPIILNLYNEQSGTSPVLTIQQEGTSRQGQEVELYIRKENNSDKDDVNKYHLVQLYSQYIKKIGNDYYYQISAYIDGKLECVFGQITNSPLLADKLQIQPINCFINLLEVDYKQVQEDTKVNGDYDVFKFYLKYQNAILRKDVSTQLLLLDYVKNFDVGLNGRVTINEADINNIASNIDTPVLVMTYQDDGQFNSLGGFMNALEAGYGEDGTAAGADMNFRVSVSWSAGKNGVEEIKLPEGYENARFRASLQGSSTKMYRVKNFNLSIENTTGTEEDEVFLYSPNFKSTDTSTFLPEAEFTLKADIVDSSHSNNTSCGRFVNTVCRKFSEDIVEDSYYKSYIKNCLDGFPILLFLCHVVYDASSDQTTYNYYYLGIYNFNLGRSSYFNLGYKDLSVFGSLEDKLLTDAGNSFTFFKIPASQNTLKEGLGVAEIQGGDPHFDFSQWDPTVLFQQVDTDPRYMFGDLVYGSNGTEQQLKIAISKFVEKVARSGGYLFDFLKKKKGKYKTDDVTEGAGYNAEVYVDGVPTGESKNQVPDYSIQYIKELSPSGQWVFKEKEQEPIVGKQLDLQDLIIPDTDSNKLASLNFQAASEYYTICMVLGLVDSVMKNLNIKSWNVKSDGTGTWYPAFYDMDTCLGINNQGNPITYFAFSDYWSSQIKKTVNDVEYPSAVQIYRDFSPNSLGENGYDVPTNYLFTVAKYAKLIFTDNSSEQAVYLSQYPQELYAKWRSNVVNAETHEGVLKNADAFMDNFFANNLASICPILVSYNYRSKYLKLATDSDTVWVSTDFNKFNGTRVNQVRDWLEGRLHILDVYFNLNRSMPQTITYRTDEGTWETLMNGNAPVVNIMYSSNYDLENNQDVVILKDIFSANGGQGVQLSGFTSFQIRCPEFSPLQIYNQIGSVHQNFIVGGDKNQQIEFTPTGVQAIKLGGSQAWTYLQNINWVTASSLYITSDKLENITGSSGKFTSLQLNTPNVRVISLTSPNYSGLLQLDGFENYPNLSEIDISNSQISLQANNLKVKKISLNNMSSPNSEVTITNCSELETLNISNVSLRSLSLEGLKGSLINLNLSGNRINTINVRCSEPGGVFTLSEDYSVTSLTIGDFQKVIISNCPNLKKIVINQKIVQDVEELQVTGCCAQGLSITSGTSEEGKITLSNSKIKVVKFQNAIGVTDVELPDNVKLLSSAFSGCTKLATVTGNNIKLADRAFSNCFNYALRDNSREYTKFVIEEGIKDLSYTFHNTQADWNAVKHIIDNVIPETNNITNVSCMFSNCILQFGLNELKSSISQDSYPNFGKLNKVTNATYMFAGNNQKTGITALNKKLMQMGSSEGCDYHNIASSFLLDAQIYYIPKDLFQGTITKIKRFPFNGDSNWANKIIFTDTLGNPLPEDTPVILSEIFNPDGIAPSKLTGLYYIQPHGNYTFDWTNTFTAGWTSLTYIENVCYQPCKYKGLDRLMFNLPKPVQMSECWNTSTLEDSQTDYYTMFNWELESQLEVIFKINDFRRINTYSNAVKKYITADDYILLIDKLLKSKTLTKLDVLFRNVTVLGSLGDWNLSNTVINSKVTSINYMFDGFSNKTSQDALSSNYLMLNSNFLQALPNIEYAEGAFANCKIGKPIPFDFFKKRYKITENVWVKKGEEYSPATLTTYRYNQQLENISYLFYNSEWDNSALQYSPDLYSINKNKVEDSDGEQYQEYYRRTIIPGTSEDPQYTYTKYDLVQNTEITDAEGLQGGYIAAITNGTIRIDNPQLIGDQNKLIIPPDLFYGLKGQLTSTRGVSYALNCKSALNGIIPKNLFKNSKNVKCDNLWKGQTVIPQLVKSWTSGDTQYKVYVHFPSGYTSNGELSQAFNANYIILYSTNSEVNYSLVILQDSIPKTVTYLKNCFDSNYIFSVIGQSLKSDNQQFNFIGNIKEDNLIMGLDTNYFSNLFLDNVFYSNYLQVVNGHLFYNEFDAGNPRLSQSSMKIMYTTVKVGDYRESISRTMILPKATNIVLNLIQNQGCKIRSSQIVESANSKQFYVRAGWNVVDE